MFDFRLQVFYKVALRLSFSKAAEELHISQPAVTRHIRQTEAHYQQKLFERKGNRITLTKAGELLVVYAQRIFRVYDELDFEMNALSNQQQGVLKIAASTTVAQYVLPGALAAFHQRFPDISIQLNSFNTENVEEAVTRQKAMIGFIEGNSKNRELAYVPFLEDEVVLVVSAKHALARRSAISLEELYTIPLLLREQGSGTLEVIFRTLEKSGFDTEKLKIEMQLGSSESIKTYLANSETAAFLSIHTIQKELKSGELFIVDVENLAITRQFSYVQQQGSQSGLAEVFIQFLKHHYPKILFKN